MYLPKNGRLIVMKRLLLLLLASCVLFIVGCEQKKSPVQSSSETATFIDDYLIDEHGNLQTDIKENKQLYLSESVGFWLHYLLIIKDQENFDQQVRIIKEKFLLSNGLISWQIKEGSVSQTNALIDDFRILTALYKATELWNNKAYNKLATKIAESIVQNQIQDDYFVDFFDGTAANNSITLSYLDPLAIATLHERGLISDAQFEINLNLVKQAPTQNSWFPQRYNLSNHTYEFEEGVNLIDQYYIGYHRALVGENSEQLVAFTRQKMTEQGKIYGRVNTRTQQNEVDYESPSVYALAILMLKELGEDSLAQQLLERMHTLQVTDLESAFYGGYIDTKQLQTHFFDNVLPLLAEEGWNE